MLTPSSALTNFLIDRGHRLLLKPREPIKFTSDPEADKLLNDIDSFPHAFVLACVMDRQIRAEKAWLIPHHISLEIGGFEFDRLIGLSLNRIKAIFTQRKLHRFNEIMANNFFRAVQRIKNEYSGNASAIWSDKPASATVIRRFLQFDGVGLKIATMATNGLTRDFKIELKDYASIDISPDVQVRRVFARIGYISPHASIDDLVYCARELHPQYPGIFDLSSWEIGRRWCRPSKPDCPHCELVSLCPKII